MPDRPVNPFIIGAPASASKFIGRREQVNTILSQLANPESRGSSAISGERRIGKTSLLHYIISPEAAAKYGLSHSQFTFVSVDTQTLGSYMDSQNLDTFSETVFWHYILRLLSIYQTPSAEYSKELLQQERVGVHDLIPLFAQVAAQDKLVVLLLDEFEWIINNIDPQRPTLLHALRSLINRPVSERGLALITSSEKPLTDLCSHIKFMGSPMPNALVPVHLRPFSTAEAYELIDEYLESTTVSFSDEDKDLAYDLSEGHPYWLQRACFEMFNRYVEKAEDNSLQGAQITIILDALDYEEIKTEIMVERGRASIPSLREREREVQPGSKIDLPPTLGRFKIFVSSTWLDLQSEREAVEEALHRMCTASFSGMEYFGSRPETPKEVCLETVSCADVYVGVFAHRYGSIDPDSGLSMTELEYREARDCNIPCLIYMMDKNVPVLPTYIEQEPEAATKLKALKQDLQRKHVVSFFTNPDNLAMQVTADLNNLFRERDIESEPSSIPPMKG
jgi:AAA+ ATPase superfamily predicted ATPase